MTYHQTCEFIAQRILEGRDYAFINGSLLPLPKPQRTGASFQRYTYAMLKAREIANTIKTPTT
tara:strand:+ start:234 stop:422 length:189 start_codon:yes stop_codon:yes gene_type:complete